MTGLKKELYSLFKNYIELLFYFIKKTIAFNEYNLFLYILRLILMKCISTNY